MTGPTRANAPSWRSSLAELNRRLDDDDYAIGPSYLINEDVHTQAGLERIWKYGIMPLLTEHFYGQRGAADRFELAAIQRAVRGGPVEPAVMAELLPSDDDDGYLVYADLDGESTGSSVVRNAGIEIVVTAVDIGGTIAELRASIVELADLVEAGRSHASVSGGAIAGAR